MRYMCLKVKIKRYARPDQQFDMNLESNVWILISAAALVASGDIDGPTPQVRTSAFNKLSYYAASFGVCYASEDVEARYR
jgi:hypothetical protein